MIATRRRGARFSLDDDAVSYEDLRRLLALRPSYVKLDRRHFERVGYDEASSALVETMAIVAGRVGAELVAERIEQPTELDALREVGVTLGQGYLLGEPGAPGARRLHHSPTPLQPAEQGRIDSALAVLVEAAVTIGEGELPRLAGAIAEHVLGFAVLINDRREPLAVLRRIGSELLTIPISVVPLSSSVRHAGRLALARPSLTRFDPMVCIDDDGGFVGMLRVERILGWLANDPEPTRPVVPASLGVARRRARARRGR